MQEKKAGFMFFFQKGTLVCNFAKMRRVLLLFISLTKRARYDTIFCERQANAIRFKEKNYV